MIRFIKILKHVLMLIFIFNLFSSDQLIVTSAENASIRLWRFDETINSSKSAEK